MINNTIVLWLSWMGFLLMYHGKAEGPSAILLWCQSICFGVSVLLVLNCWPCGLNFDLLSRLRGLSPTFLIKNNTIVARYLNTKWHTQNNQKCVEGALKPFSNHTQKQHNCNQVVPEAPSSHKAKSQRVFVLHDVKPQPWSLYTLNSNIYDS